MCELSLIVPIYNVGQYLRPAIESLLGQKPMDYEIVLVDDGSTDGSGDICEEYANRPNVRILHKPNGGLVSARKAGLMASSGKYVGFLDGDDYAEGDYYFNMLTRARETDADVVCCSHYLLIHDRTEPVQALIPDGVYVGEALENLREHLIFAGKQYRFGIKPNAWSKLYKRQWLEEWLMRVPDEIVNAEDAMWTYPILYHCGRVCVYLENTGYAYRYREDAMSKAYHPRITGRLLTAMEYFDTAMADQFDRYGAQMYQYLSLLLKSIIGWEATAQLDGTAQKVCVRNLKAIRQQRVVQKTISHIEDVGFGNRLLLVFYRFGCYRAALTMMAASRGMQRRKAEKRRRELQQASA